MEPSMILLFTSGPKPSERDFLYMLWRSVYSFVRYPYLTCLLYTSTTTYTPFPYSPGTNSLWSLNTPLFTSPCVDKGARHFGIDVYKRQSQYTSKVLLNAIDNTLSKAKKSDNSNTEENARTVSCLLYTSTPALEFTFSSQRRHRGTRGSAPYYIHKQWNS